MYAFLLSKHAFLERVYSQILSRRRATQTSKHGIVTIYEPKHIKGPINKTILKLLNLGKRTSKTDSGRQITLRTQLNFRKVNREIFQKYSLEYSRTILRIFCLMGWRVWAEGP